MILSNQLIYLCLILPLILSVAKWELISLAPIAKFIFIYLTCSFFVIQFLEAKIFDTQHYNWVGKSISLLVMLPLFLLPSLKVVDFNFSLKFKMKECRKLFLFCGAYFLLRVFIYLFTSEASAKIHLETLLYQATLPGLQEEILYRGVLLSLIHKISRTHGIALGNLPISWAALITSILFGLEHGIELGSDGSLNISYFSIIRTFIDAFIFARLTERTKSLMPAIMYHNLLNLIGNH